MEGVRMSLFSQEAINSFRDSSTLDPAREQLQALHKAIYDQLRLNNIDLNLIHSESHAVQEDSVSDVKSKQVLSVVYLRTRGQAVQVERLMGREEVANINSVEARRHPVIELRLSPEHFTVELLLSPDAWWDQQNLMGKLTVQRYKQDFYGILQGFDSRYCMGFWRGSHLSEMHLSAKHFRHPRIMDEWISTFQPSADWFRLGTWYGLDEEVMEATTAAEIAKQIRSLNQLYHHILWTSDNNFREFFLAPR
jgi:hypothetical protein